MSGELDAILSIDTTKGNRIINKRGFAISNTVKAGYILRVSEDLLSVMDRTMNGEHVFPERTPEVKMGMTTSYDLTQAELEVIAANSGAIALYKSLGFEICGTMKHAMKYKDGTYADMYTMAKQL